MKIVKKYSIDELFRSRLEGAGMEKTASFWTLLEHQMKEKKRRRKLFFVRFFFIGFFVFMLGLFLINKDTQFLNKDIQIVQENRTLIEINTEQKNKNIELTELPENESYSLNVIKPNKKDTISTTIKNSKDDRKLITNNNPLSENYITSTATTEYVAVKDDSVKVIINLIGKSLNSPYADYAPVINADGSEMFFTSRRPYLDKRPKKGGGKQENIYYSQYNSDQKDWKDAVILSSPVNEKSRFNSAVALSNDGQRLFIYRDDKKGDGDIYESVLNGTKWSNPQPLPGPINSKHLETSVSLSPDGSTMYFVSNRPGGYGSLDIWYCNKDTNGDWGEAQNLGPNINTPSEEEGVFMHPDGRTLYFSSRGHKGEGNYDIFYTRFENGNWSSPVNLGDKINTSKDDVYFVMEASGKHAYYASEQKEGKGEKDIYKITFSYPEKEYNAKLTLFKGNVLDGATKLPLDAEIELMDLEKNELITTVKTNSATGAFMISLPAGKNYAIIVLKEDYLFYSENFNIPQIDAYKEVNKTILLNKLIAGSKVVMKNIFYDYNMATLRPESKIGLDKLYKLLVQNTGLKVELSAHSDSRGSNTYNLQLSQERAQSCVDYLINKGVNKTQVVAKGYGEQQLVISNEEIENMKNEHEKENAHQKNRRTEIKIIEND